jgi:acyl-CoA synthetase (AMP-forming)/AMP-acid ligase II
MVHQIRNTGARLILAHPSMVQTAVTASNVIAKETSTESRIFQMSDSFCQPYLGVPDFRQLAASDEDAASYSWQRLSPAQSKATIATINYSSGTTGPPKGVCVSHYNLIANVEQTIRMRWDDLADRQSQGHQERWVGFLPLYHAYGQLYTILMAVKLRVPVYVMKAFVYRDFLACVQTQRITTLQIAPPILVMLAKRPETAEYDVSSVKDVLCGAAPLSRELQNECMARFGFNVAQGWGMTEVTCGALHVPAGRVDTSGSVGELDPNTECMLLDDEGREVGPGEPGELYIRGPQVCLGYWRNEQATKESLSEDGWLRTGDVAVINEKGSFWIVDRKKELIKVNALQVAPAELEAVLLEHPDVADSAVVGITLHDEEWPRAYVALQEHAKGKVTPHDIQKWIMPRVAKHKHLVGGVTFIDEVPKLASGKIQRKVLKEWSKRDALMLQSQVKARF